MASINLGKVYYDARIRLQTKIFKQTFHHHLDNFIRFQLIYSHRFVGVWWYIRKTENAAQGER